MLRGRGLLGHSVRGLMGRLLSYLTHRLLCRGIMARVNLGRRRGLLTVLSHTRLSLRHARLDLDLGHGLRLATAGVVLNGVAPRIVEQVARHASTASMTMMIVMFVIAASTRTGVCILIFRQRRRFASAAILSGA